ncbi:hypothetical protein HanRHA438_Chr15g0700071 [Helianthus annuus]|nr:hypothetical protein HanIR_Chr15g0747401 [Helianthus annuus]KAJ0844227.1 hypothetical protein HanRHA438_Chr15g0700071 [Helianthus annuus]
MGNRKFSPAKTEYRVADSPVCPDILRLPLRRVPSKTGYMICQTSDKISLNNILTGFLTYFGNMKLLYTFNLMKGMYITADEIYKYIDMYIYKEFQKSIKNKAQAYVSIINIDFFIRNLSHISIIPMSNIISFDHLPRNSCNKIILETH